MQIPVLSDPKADNLLDYKNNKQNRIGRKYGNLVGHTHSLFSGADPGELKWVNFHPPFSEPLLSFYSYPSNIEIIFDFSDIITKIHPPFQNPGSALDFI